MYFGSVKFFKQIIYSTVICSAAVMAAFALLFGIKCSADSGDASPASSSGTQNERTVSAKGLNVPGGTPMKDIYLAMAEHGYTDEDIVRFLADNNSPYLESYVKSKADELGGVDSNAPVFDSSYGANAAYKTLYPDMYADSRTDSFPEGGNPVYLVFLGGSSDGCGEILDVLDAHGIKAAFFADDPDDKDFISEIYSSGHTAGILCPGTVSGEKQTAAGLEKVYGIFTDISTVTGSAPVIFSCGGDPAGNELSAEMSRRGFERCDITVFVGAGPEDVRADKSIEGAGRTIVGIDGRSCGADRVEYIISRMESEGFLFSDPISTPAD